jgi:hypothetical protein
VEQMTRTSASKSSSERVNMQIFSLKKKCHRKVIGATQ